MTTSDKCENNLTLRRMICSAQTLTSEAANLKDWRCRSKRNQRMREIARQWSADKGYRICSLYELKVEYGDLVHYNLMGDESDNKKQVWCIVPPFLKPHHIEFLCCC